MNISKVLDKLIDYYKEFEEPAAEHFKETPFKVLFSCLLSLRARDETTIKVSKKLFEKVKTPEELASLPTKELEKIIYSSGHYKKKARTLKHVASELVSRFNSKVPETKSKLMSIKGIGPKTANIVLNVTYGKNVIPVDTHVHRIPNRLGWIKTKTPEKTERELYKIVPEKYWSKVNYYFVLHGQNTCTPISPFCSKCPIRRYCKQVGVERKR